MKLIKKFRVEITFSLALFLMIFYVSYKTPLAGDDWAFYNNAMKYSLVESAMSMYYNWEGRLATLFSIHFLILHKSLWNVMNASIYTSIFLISNLLIKPKKKILFGFLFLFLIFTMKENIRMEVITWITGSVYYGLPLLMSFVFLGTNYYVFENRKLSIHPLIWILMILSGLYLPIGMENIAIASMIGSVFLNVVSYIQNKKISIFHSIGLFALMLSYTIWFLSPGSSIRLAQMPEWSKLSFIGKILQTLPNVLYFTFYQNKYLISVLSLSISILNIQKKKSIWMYGVFVFYGVSVILLFSERLLTIFPNIGFISFLADGYSIVNLIFWMLFALVLIANVVWLGFNLKSFNLPFFTFVAVFSNAALLMSPVIGYRLMIYSILYLILVISIIFQELRWNRWISTCVLIGLFLITSISFKTLYFKFSTVQSITNERNAIIEDYHQYPSFYNDGIWLPRYPIYTIHGGDIEIDDTFHMEAFKIYHSIPQETDVIFYWKDSY